MPGCKADCALLCQMPKVPSERSSCPKASIWTVPSGPAPPSRPSSSTAWRWSSSGASTWWGGSAPSWRGSSTSPRLRYHRHRPCVGCEMPRPHPHPHPPHPPSPIPAAPRPCARFARPAQAPGEDGRGELSRGRARGAHTRRGRGGGIAELRGEAEALRRAGTRVALRAADSSERCCRGALRCGRL